MSWSWDLPDGRTIRLADEVRDRLQCGVLVLENVQVTPDENAAQETVEIARGLVEKYRDLLPSAIAALAPARVLYKSFGMDPSRHRPSSEALLRRVLKGKELYRINSAVDSCNLASLRFLLPVGMYDLDLVAGDVSICVGAEGDHYEGIRKGAVNVGQRLALYDAKGPFGSPTSDSDRTSVSETTVRILAVIFAPKDSALTDMSENVDLFADVFARHCGARTAATHILGEEDET